MTNVTNVNTAAAELDETQLDQAVGGAIMHDIRAAAPESDVVVHDIVVHEVRVRKAGGDQQI
jgi:hypothetical protein